MQKLSLTAAALIFSLGATVTLFAAPATEPAASQPTTTASTSPATISVNDKDALANATGKNVTLSGKVSSVNWLPSGAIGFINFEGNERGDFTAIVKKYNRDAVEKAFDGDLAKALKGKKIELKGKLIAFKGAPEIEVSKPDQITIIPD